MALCIFIGDSVYYASKLIRLIKNRIKLLKSLHFENFLLINHDFLSF